MSGGGAVSRTWSAEFLRLRGLALEWLESYYDCEHLRRAADWMLVLAPEAPEPLVLAALVHDLERSVPGGPVLDRANTPWDDPAYNRAHCDRSAEVIAGWLAREGAPAEFLEGTPPPIREHEFGGSPHGDLMQAADSISFLETNSALVAAWICDGVCSLEKGLAKLDWMRDRVRLERAQPIAAHHHARAVADVRRRVGTGTVPISTERSG